MEFCSPFDEKMAQSGPAAVFLLDREGLLRFHSTWTRDAWGRASGPHLSGWSWVLLRDRGSGFVQLALVTSPTLVRSHPRADVRTYDSYEAACAARSELGNPPLSMESW
jgi:hypothetical protein